MAAIKKQPSETLLVNFTFAKKMATAELIVSVDSSTSYPADITFGAPVINPQTSDILISGGNAPTRTDVDFTPYKITMIVTTDAGQVLEQDLDVNVQDI